MATKKPKLRCHAYIFEARRGVPEFFITLNGCEYRLGKLVQDREHAFEIQESVNACAGLPSPADNIKELVEAAKAMVVKYAVMGTCLTSNEAIRLQDALAPFEEGKEEAHKQEATKAPKGERKGSCIACVLAALRTNSSVVPPITSVVFMDMTINYDGKPSIEMWRCGKCGSVYAWPKEEKPDGN